MDGMSTRPILLVDDDDADAELTALALKRAGIEHKFSRAGDGDTALALLRREPPYDRAWPPAMVLLDLQLPPAGGFALLEQIKQDPTLRHIPVIVFSSSVRPDDVRRAYASHANAYIEKPASLNGFVEVLREVAHHWLNIVRPYPGI